MGTERPHPPRNDFIGRLTPFIACLTRFIDCLIPFIACLTRLIACLIAFIGRLIRFIDCLIAFIDGLIAFIGRLIAFIDGLIAFIGRLIAFIDCLIAFIGRLTPFLPPGSAILSNWHTFSVTCVPEMAPMDSPFIGEYSSREWVIVNRIDVEEGSNGVDRDAAATCRLVKLPVPRFVSSIELNPRFILRYEDVLAKRFDAPVVSPLCASVIRLARRRKDLDNHDGIEQRAGVVQIRLELATNDARVGVGRETGLGDPNAQIRGEDAARLSPKRAAKLAENGSAESRVLRSSPRHRINGAIQELVTDFCRELRSDVFRASHAGARSADHAGSVSRRGTRPIPHSPPSQMRRRRPAPNHFSRTLRQAR